MVHSGCNVTIKVIVKNEGIFVETINVTVYYEDNNIEKQSVNLAPAAYRILTFMWDTTGVPLGNHTIKAEASIIPQESDIEDNTLVDGTIRIIITGDVNDDGKVNVMDKLRLDLALSPGTPYYRNWPPADVNGDGKVNVMDKLRMDLILSPGSPYYHGD